MLKYFLYFIIFLFIAAIVLRLSIPSLSKKPTNLGVNNNQLAPCADMPNCVSSFATDAGHAIAPIAFTGSAADARTKLFAALNTLPNATIETNEGNYIHATTRSRLMGYVDDNEFLIDEKAGVIHVRAAARLGQSDMGANRARVELIRAGF